MKTRIASISIFFFIVISLIEPTITHATDLATAIYIQKQGNHLLESNYASVAKLDIPFSAEGTPNKAYSHGEPTNKEQYMLELINRARANPLEEIKRILSANSPDVNSAIDTYNISITELVAEFASYSPMPPLAFNPELMSAAHKHARDMADNDFQGHIGSDGSTLKQRLKQAGYEYKAAGENVFAYAQSVEHGHSAFLIDWGVDDLGHRKNELGLIDGSDFREIGIAIVAENAPGTSVGPLVIAENFGRSYSGVVFITGVVYRDNNNNNFYDSGEGLSNVKVIPNHGTYYAITSESGGYAIPVIVDSGKYDLHIERSDLPELHSAINVSQQNVKADFILGNPELGTIQGQIVDKNTNQPLSGIVVTLKPINTEFTTTNDGTFIFSDLPAANYILTAQLTEYKFEPNDFGISLASGQNVKIKLQAEKLNIPQAENVENNVPIAGACSAPAVILIFILLSFCKMLSVRENQ